MISNEMKSFSALPGSGGGATLPTTRVALLPRGPHTPHATYRASGGGGAVALRWAGGVPSDLRLLHPGGKTCMPADDRVIRGLRERSELDKGSGDFCARGARKI